MTALDPVDRRRYRAGELGREVDLSPGAPGWWRRYRAGERGLSPDLSPGLPGWRRRYRCGEQGVSVGD